MKKKQTIVSKTSFVLLFFKAGTKYKNLSRINSTRIRFNQLYELEVFFQSSHELFCRVAKPYFAQEAAISYEMLSCEVQGKSLEMNDGIVIKRALSD